jgi:hypothetical protein
MNTVTPAVLVDDRTDRQKFADSLRDLARFIETHPRVQVPIRETFYIFPKKEEIGTYARELGKAKKRGGDTFFDLVKDFGPACELQVSWYREQVCERVVVGTETVEERVPDTYTTQTVTRDKVEWHCPKVLEPLGMAQEPQITGGDDDIPF